MKKLIFGLLTILTAPSFATPCGLVGSVDDRIKDCSNQETSINGNFVLVTRTDKLKEVHKDTKSGLLWGDRLQSHLNHENAIKFCRAEVLAGLIGRLPTIEEYEEANINGIRTALPNMNHFFRSSTIYYNDDNFVWLFNGNNGDADFYKRSQLTSVRCVAL